MKQQGTISHFTSSVLAFTLLLAPLCWSQDPIPEETTSSETRRAPIDLKKQHLELLSKEIDSDEIRWLTDASGKKFLSLWQADKTANPYGAILILPGEGQSVDDPGEIQAIRNDLPHFGWSTLVIDLPSPDTDKVPPRPSENKESEDTEEATAPPAPPKEAEQEMSKGNPEEITKQRLDAAITFLKQQGQYNIVIIGHGVNAARAMRYIRKISGNTTRQNNNRKRAVKIQRPIRAAVFVEARNQIPTTGRSLIDFFDDKFLPIIDIYYGDHFLDTLEIKSRRNAARNSGIKHYYQVKLLRPHLGQTSEENRLTRRIRGFLNKHAKGVEIGRY